MDPSCAGVAQGQSKCFVNTRSGVQIPPPAYAWGPEHAKGARADKPSAQAPVSQPYRLPTRGKEKEMRELLRFIGTLIAVVI